MQKNLFSSKVYILNIFIPNKDLLEVIQVILTFLYIPPIPNDKLVNCGTLLQTETIYTVDEAR
jgi:hypothetical protein